MIPTELDPVMRNYQMRLTMLPLRHVRLPRLKSGVSVNDLAAQLSCSRQKSRTPNIGRARLANHSLRDLRTRLRHYLVSFPGDIGNIWPEQGLFECFFKKYLTFPTSPRMLCIDVWGS